MASTVILTTFIIVVSVSVFSEQHYLNNLHKSIPNHWQHDQEELGRRVDQVPWRNKVKKHSRPLLNLRQPIPWHQWTHQGRLGHKEKDIEAQKIRRHLLEEKLKLNHAIPRYGGQILPQAKPKVKGAGQEIHRAKRAVKQTNDNIPNTNDYKPKPIVNSRKKREIIIVPQLQPELVGVRSQAQAQFQNKLEKKREKRQILYLINRPAQILQRRRRTTPNPFIRETDIKHYDIGSADLREQFIPGGAGNSDSYEINEEASEFSKIISAFYLTTRSENWPEIQQFAHNVLKPLSEVMQTGKASKVKMEIREKEKSYERVEALEFTIGKGGWNTMLPDKENFGEFVKKRIKRRVNKTLQRKRAKKRKAKQRRVERKRLRMLTHARRVRRQQKSKLARLQRHYARMNLTTQLPNNMTSYNISMVSQKHIGSEQHNMGGGSNEKNKDESYESDEDYEDGSSEYSNISEDNKDNNKYESKIKGYVDSSYSDNGSDEEYDEDDEEDDEDYEEDDDSNHEYVEYENVTDEPQTSDKKNKRKNKPVTRHKTKFNNLLSLKTPLQDNFKKNEEHLKYAATLNQN